MKVYISGAIATDPDAPARFSQAARMLKGAGHEPVNPFDIKPDCDTSCAEEVGAIMFPHTLHSWQCHLKADIIEMLKCDAVAHLHTWVRSDGARLEIQTAHGVKMHVGTVESYLL